MHEEAAAAGDLELEVRLGEGAALLGHEEGEGEDRGLGVPIVAVDEDLAPTGTV